MVWPDSFFKNIVKGFRSSKNTSSVVHDKQEKGTSERKRNELKTEPITIITSLPFCCAAFPSYGFTELSTLNTIFFSVKPTILFMRLSRDSMKETKQLSHFAVF